MKLLIIIPAYNEEMNVVRVVEGLRACCPQYEYIVVSDGSDDRTVAICREHGYPLLNEIIHLGLAGSFRTGLQYALRSGYDAAIQYDGDGQHRAEYIEPMLQKLGEGWDIVIGSRFIQRKRSWEPRMLGSRMLDFCIWLTTRQKISDPTSGMRMYNRRILELMATKNNFGPEPDTIAHLIRCGAYVCEVPVQMEQRIAGKSYLNLPRSIHYMLTMGISILLVQWFRKKEPLAQQAPKKEVEAV